MQRKIFIGIELPQKIKKRLSKAILDKYSDLPVKWVSESGFHATLHFLGYVDDDLLGDICEKVERACQRCEAFDIVFEKITLAPDIENPKMFWLEGGISEEMRIIYTEIEKELGIFQAEKKSFRPHVTLGRIRKKKWDDLKNKPVVDEKFSSHVSVSNIQVFESRSEGKKKIFEVVESFSLN